MFQVSRCKKYVKMRACPEILKLQGELIPFGTSCRVDVLNLSGRYKNY